MQDKATSNNPTHIIAGVAFAILGLMNVIWMIQDISYGVDGTILLTIAGTIAYILMAVVLFMNKKSILPAIAAGIIAIWDLYYLFYGFTWNRYSVQIASNYWNSDDYIFNLFCFLPAFLLTMASVIFALYVVGCSIEQCSRYKEKIKNIWFVPAAIYLLSRVLHVMLYYAVPQWNGGYSLFYFSSLLEIIATVIGFACACLWIVNSEKTETLQRIEYTCEELEMSEYQIDEMKKTVDTEAVAAVQPKVYPDGYCEMIKHILLLVFTLGIWNYVWIYRTTRFLNCVKGEEQRSELNQLLLCLFVPFYVIYWVYKSAQRIDKLAAQRGIESDLTMISLLFAIFIYILAPIFMQDKINNIVMPVEKTTYAESANAEVRTVTQAPAQAVVVEVKTAPEVVTPVTETKDIASELRAYKELLDSGILTQEEFDAKKKQILGL